MNEIAQRLTLLAEKVKEIIRTNEDLREENERLKQSLFALEQKTKDQSDRLVTKDEENNISLTAKPLYIGDSKEAAREKIDDLVRELDFCLTLLNS